MSAPKLDTPEGAFLSQVLDLAALYQWKCFHLENATRVITRRSGVHVRVRNVNAQGVGFPDLVLVKGPRLAFRELKRDVGPRGGTADKELTPEQREWFDRLAVVADAVHHWTRRWSVTQDPATRPEVSVGIWRPADLETLVLPFLRGNENGGPFEPPSRPIPT